MSVRPLFHDLAVLPFEHPMTLVGSRVARSKIWPILKINNPHEDLLQRQIWLHSIVLSLPFWTRWQRVWSSKQLRWLKSPIFFWHFENSFCTTRHRIRFLEKRSKPRAQNRSGRFSALRHRWTFSHFSLWNSQMLREANSWPSEQHLLAYCS